MRSLPNLLTLITATTLLAAPGRGPRLLAPGVVATGESESHATLSPDGKTLYFVKLTPDFAHWTAVASERRGGRWTEPSVAWFSGRWSDADVSFAPDASTLYFISNRPDRASDPARADHDLFRMRRTSAGWSEPERIVELASPGAEWFPNQTADGTLYFGSERQAGNLGPAGTSDLWRARWLGDRFAEPENLGPTINTAGQDIEPWISADGRTLVFASKGRTDSLGSYDLYVSHTCAGVWSAPRPLGGGVNSPAWEFGGRFSPDGKTFFFASNRTVASPAGRTLAGRGGYRELVERLRSPGNGLFDLYEIDASEIGLGVPCDTPTRGSR